ncbi:MAG: hypothetical protein F6K51_36175, partial [Moorea sp. SIO3I8]|nr:hypothetical protein [Moorena sp. SIO3I8]
CYDAIVAIHTGIKQKPKWVLDADIAKCFDKINHDALLSKLNTYPSMRRLSRSCKKKGGILQIIKRCLRKESEVWEPD